MKPTRDELAKHLYYATPAEVAAFHGVHYGSVIKWMQEYKLTKQPIPLEDKLLMIELYYREGVKPREIFRKFKEEITILTMQGMYNILRPRSKKDNNMRYTTYEEARDFHLNLASEE